MMDFLLLKNTIVCSARSAVETFNHKIKGKCISFILHCEFEPYENERLICEKLIYYTKNVLILLRNLTQPIPKNNFESLHFFDK